MAFVHGFVQGLLDTFVGQGLIRWMLVMAGATLHEFHRGKPESRVRRIVLDGAIACWMLTGRMAYTGWIGHAGLGGAWATVLTAGALLRLRISVADWRSTRPGRTVRAPAPRNTDSPWYGR